MWFKLVLYLIEFGLLIWSLFTPSGRNAWGWFWNNLVGAALKQATPLVKELSIDLAGIATSFSTAWKANGTAIQDALGTDFQDVAATLLQAQRGALAGGAPSTPENAIDNAAEAFKVAFGAGLTSAGVTALFEALFPEKLNTLNGVGPMVAKMAGFDEVAAEVLGPLYRNAFGKSLDYYYRSLFKPEYPSEGDAVRWHSRRLDKTWTLDEIFANSGLKAKYEDAYIKSAYRPVPPFLLARAAEAGFVPESALTDALQFGGSRDEDINTLETAYTQLALQPYRNSALSAAKRSAELGTRSASDFADDLNYLKIPTDAQLIVQFEVAERKLEQLAELYRKSITESYLTGQITDAQYVPSLEAIGIAEADAQAHYAVDSIKKTGKVMLATARAEAALLRRQQAAAVRTAVEIFQTGGFGPVSPGAASRSDAAATPESTAGAEAALLAALIATGLDPTIAGFVVTYQAARLTGRVVYLYGLMLDRADALVLRETVAAIEAQYKKQLIDDAQAAAAMAAQNIPDVNAQAMLATWAALKVKPTTYGAKLPR